MNPQNPIHAAALALALAAAGTLTAQGRVELKADVKTSPSFQPVAQGGEAQGPFQDAFTSKSDVPDFAPYRAVITKNADGEMVVTGQELLFNPYTLSFPAKNFAPTRGIDPRMLLAQAKDPSGQTFGYIMIRNAISDPRKLRQLRDLGVKILGPHTFQSYQAVIPLGQLDIIGALPFVHWVGYAQPEQKVSPQLAAAVQRGGNNQRFRVDISTFATDLNDATRWVSANKESVGRQQTEASVIKVIPNGPFHRALIEAGLEFDTYTDVDNVHIFRGYATRDQIAKIRDLEFVSYIETVQAHVLYHDQSMAMINQDRVRGTYHGGTITVGIIDSGVQSPSGGRHRDLGPKWLYGSSTVTGGAFIDPCSHGTHVTGTVTGEGIANNDYKGAAPGLAHTKLSSLRIGRYFGYNSSTGKCPPSGSVSTLYAFMAGNSSTLGPKPRAINNSWGADSSSGYNGAESAARTLDSYIYTNNQCHVFASGNSGKWCGSPGAAKNALTVGGVIDYWSGSSVVPGNPYSNSGCGTSDVGGTRRKPEVTAPASSVTSLGITSTSSYSKKSGTSMATPHVTGAVASMIHHHPTLYSYRVPNIKATAMASAEYQGNPGSSSGWFNGPGGGTGLGSGAGYGMINASSMHTSSTHGYYTGYYTGEFTSSGQWVFWEVNMPSTMQHAKVVANWIETAASSGATKARRADIRLYCDISPFSSSGNVGEFNNSSSVSNVLSIASHRSATSGFCNSSAGKKVRFKMHAASVPSGTRCKVGFTVMWHSRKATSPTPTLAMTASSYYVKPSASLTLYGTVSSASTGDEAENARVYPSNLNGFTVTRLYRYSADNILHSYTGSSHPSSPFPSLTGGMTIGQGLSRQLRFVVRAPSSSVGSRTVTLGATADPGNRVLTASRSICVDGIIPATPSSLRSTSHTRSVWSNNRNVSFAWSVGADSGCAGLTRQRYAIRQSSCPTPSTSTTTTRTSITMSSLAETTSSTGHYFAVRSEDRAGNIGGRACTGPYLIDVGRPVVTSFRIGGGATYTRSLSTSIQSAGTDSRSGVTQMRHSNSGSTWSPWTTYSTAARSWSLSSYGGSTAQGVKRVYCQLRDRAGNISSSLSDTIVYDSSPPVISSCRINSGATYTGSLKASLQTTVSGGPVLMQYSNNNSTWSSLVTYTSSLTVSLSAYGGNTAPGTKRVYVRTRDAAGNYSTSCLDTIVYLVVPRITGGTTTTLSNVTRSYYRLTGSGFTGANRVDFGSSAITSPWTSANDDWWKNGAYRVISDSVIYVYPPQGLPAAQYSVRVRNPLFLGTAFNVFVTYETGRLLYSNSNPTSGKPITISVARGPEPQTTPCIIAFSPQKLPTVIPGVISLEIGNSNTTLLLFPMLGFNSGTRTLTIDAPTLPAHSGLTLYFEAAYIRNPLPIPTTNSWQCKIK